MVPKRLMRATVLCLVAALGTGTQAWAAAAAAVPSHPASPAAGAQAGAPPQLPETERMAMRRQAPLTRAARMIRDAAALAGHGSGYAGIKLRTDRVVVWWKGVIPSRVTAAIGQARKVAPVRVQPAANSEAELMAASRRLWAAAGMAHGGPLIGIQLPFDGSGLTAVVATGRASALPASALARAEVPVRVTSMVPPTWANATRCDDSPQWWGGGAIFNATVGGGGLPCGGNSSRPFDCTAGFAVTFGGNQYLTTAGHCGIVGDVFTDPTGQTIGTMAYKDQSQDLALIRAPASGQVWDGLPGSSDFARPVTGWGWSFAGEVLCFTGTTSGAAVCGGTVDNSWVYLCGKGSRGDQECYFNLVSMIGIRAQGGDSGGPVFQLDATGTKETAVGSVTGWQVQPTDPTDLTVWTLFQQVGTATQDWSGLNVIPGNGVLYAPTVTVLEHNTTNCPGTQQYFTTTDFSGNAIGWTYANGSHQCIRVSYFPELTSASCTYSFYVPNGDATGKINFTISYLVNGNPHTASVILDENPISGFTKIYTGSNVVSINFGDNNGSQTYPVKLGWGTSVDHSLRQAC